MQGGEINLIGNILIVIALAIALFFSIIAIFKGHKGMKMSKSFMTNDTKVKYGYWLVSGIHMWVGILITLCYLIAGVLILSRL